MEEDSFRIGYSKWFGGGIGGGFGINNQGVLVESEEETGYLKREEETLKLQKEGRNNLSDGGGKIPELHHTVLGSGRWQSEGVGEDLLFIRGGDGAGPHKRISSDKHSQADKDLGGGRKISIGQEWFGPRRVFKTLEDMEKVDKEKFKSYWPIIQKSAQYLSQEDLDGIQRYGANRDRELEEDIFGLYHGGNGWAEKFGKKKDKDQVDLEFDFSKLKQMLSKTEKELRDQKGTYGRIFQNHRLAKLRLLGDVEATAFNYLKHIAGPEAETVKKLKEKKIAIAILALMSGEEIGFDCDKGEQNHKSQFFDECLAKVDSSVKVKRVLKSTWKYKNEYGVPLKKHGGLGHLQRPLREKPVTQQLIKMNDINSTSLLDEKREEAVPMGQFWIYGETEIRREICDQIIRPWFGDGIDDKRLCLIETKEFKNYFRLNTCLQVLEIPLGNKRNTFGTKCSNYVI